MVIFHGRYGFYLEENRRINSNEKKRAAAVRGWGTRGIFHVAMHACRAPHLQLKSCVLTSEIN